ncbi:hypothetical protein SKAU_G00239350 [Synaphobranchus kaupii]|uniref:Uncharacterized protein n=1 Tax=Synaphobranchus kaupii TaxID=118154 RepID=A0A9Q1F786_SYNKA|nr:hypothetical protein SKAU_G00239350 [Synaphobranchus kaupii]
MLPKVHKDFHNPPERPIISNNDTISEPASKYIDYYIKPFVSKLPSFLQDTTHTLNRLAALGDTLKDKLEWSDLHPRAKPSWLSKPTGNHPCGNCNQCPHIAKANTDARLHSGWSSVPFPCGVVCGGWLQFLECAGLSWLGVVLQGIRREETLGE